MKRLDLDDVPPKIAALLGALAPGEEVLLVQAGAVVGRLTGAAKPEVPSEPDTEVDPTARAKEVFELFRSSIEDEF